MEAPRRDRRSAAVDAQLADFETGLRDRLFTQLMNIDREYWWHLGAISGEDATAIGHAVTESLAELKHRYSASEGVITTLNFCEVLIRNVVWAAMNVPAPAPGAWTGLHEQAVIDNALTVYNQNIYALLRTEMIMASHHAEVLQRTWRRCYYEPEYIVCRRRLLRQFNELERMSVS